MNRRNFRADFQCRLRQKRSPSRYRRRKLEHPSTSTTDRPARYRAKAASTTAPAANTPPLTLDAAPVASIGPLVVAEGAEVAVPAALVAGTLAE